MRFYEDSCRQLIDFPQLLNLYREAKIYSIEVVEIDERWEVFAEVVTRDKGIQKLKVKHYAHVSFESEARAQALLISALKAPDPRKIDWHLMAPDGKHLLCGPPIDTDEREPFQTMEVDKFFASTAHYSGPRCNRCKTQAFVFGIRPTAEETAPDERADAEALSETTDESDMP